MASYHLDVKTIRRAQGRSATAAAAYRAGERIACDRYGVEHDYTRKGGVLHAEIIAPDTAPEWVSDRAALWNAAEASEVRKNSVVAREWEVALPHELSDAERRDLALGFARGLVERYGVAADVAIHAPHREGDQRNHHAHILTTTRRMGPEGLEEKTRELDVKQTSSKEVTAMRESWAGMQNDALERAGDAERVDHRSLEAQREEAERVAREAQERGEAEAALQAQLLAEALAREAEPKLGPRVSAIERRARREAEVQGVDYVPLTERGAAVVARREERSVFEAARGRFDEARDAYGVAREQGVGRVDAFAEGLRALLRREEEGRNSRGETNGAREGVSRDPVADKLRGLLARSEGRSGAQGAGEDAPAGSRAPATELEVARLKAERGAGIAWEMVAALPEGADRDKAMRAAEELDKAYRRLSGGGGGQDAPDEAERAEAVRREDAQRREREAQEARDRERAKDPRSDAEIEHTRKQIEAIRAKTRREREREELDRDRDDDDDPWDR